MGILYLTWKKSGHPDVQLHFTAGVTQEMYRNCTTKPLMEKEKTK